MAAGNTVAYHRGSGRVGFLHWSATVLFRPSRFGHNARACGLGRTAGAIIGLWVLMASPVIIVLVRAVTW
ncbi:MAG TPA: hypothetical protein VJ714_05565 [Anaerolineae bacterium]|nr:hypothetical protein [Anaerolineae bacterium]